MKKRILALVLAISCTVIMTACGDSGKTVENEVQEKASSPDAAFGENAFSQDSDLEENTAADDASPKSTLDDTEETKAEETEAKETKASALNTPATLSDDLYDFRISIDGTVYQFPMWYSDFEALGWEYDGDNTDTLSNNQYTGSQRWKKDGFSIYTEIANLSMNTVVFSDSMVAGISMDKYDLKECDWEILLPAGIQWGVSGTDDIMAAYGEPASDYDGSNYYKMSYQYDYYREIELYVYKDSGVLEKIRIENLVELEDAAAAMEVSNSQKSE